jgi:hypothetical protein
MVIRDLTLRSAASFGSFHLIRLLYDEYMFFLIEHKVAQSLGETPIGVMGGCPERVIDGQSLVTRTTEPLGNNFLLKTSPCKQNLKPSVSSNNTINNNTDAAISMPAVNSVVEIPAEFSSDSVIQVNTEPHPHTEMVTMEMVSGPTPETLGIVSSASQTPSQVIQTQSAPAAAVGVIKQTSNATLPAVTSVTPSSQRTTSVPPQVAMSGSKTYVVVQAPQLKGQTIQLVNSKTETEDNVDEEPLSKRLKIE